ncbi:MAG: amidohydrolase family protein [bacterium]|nr:amidohydrolase family protein [bacterium]
MTTTAPAPAGLDYPINDADNHFNEPKDCFERYIDPQYRDLAIRMVTGPNGERLELFAGAPSKFNTNQVTFSNDELKKMLGDDPNIGATSTRPVEDDESAAQIMPGMLLNRLNPLKGLSEEERAEFIAEFKNKSEAYGNRDLRLALMDEQGIDKAVMFPAAAHNIEYEFVDNIPALYANTRAFNRWMHEEPGFNADNRMFLPPYIPLADPELAVKELEIVLEQGAMMIQTKSGHAHGGADNPFGGRSVADPVYDKFWSICNEAGVRYAVHLGGTDYQKYGADWSYEPTTTFGDFDAFQWVMYWGDRPAAELTAALVLHNFFGRFPNIKVLLAEQGTVWLPYTLRKMDHAFMMGRKAKYSETGRLNARPSEIYKQHFYVAPFPEENVQRVASEIGVETLVFGSDFPHGEGLARPAEYVDSQLSSFGDDITRQIMRDNMEDFLAPCLV